MPKVISIVNGKGGVGKSTITSNLAGFLFNEKKEVLIVDLDFQSSSLDWAALARASGYEICDVVSLANESTERHLIVKNTQLQIERFKRKYEYILIDCRGSIDEFIIGALRSSDTVITPLSSSSLDLQATGILLDMYENINASKNFSMQLFLVLNNVVPNTKSTKEVIDALEKRIQDVPGITLCNAIIFRREEYKSVWANGQSIFSSENQKAKNEFFSFIKEIQLLGEINGLCS